jgi:hypothetical protein
VSNKLKIFARQARLDRKGDISFLQEQIIKLTSDNDALRKVRVDNNFFKF